MSRKPVATMVGLAACALLAWSCYRLALGTACDTGPYDCPSGWSVALLGLGLAAAIVATIFGGGVVVFATTMLAIGIGFGAGGLRVTGDGRLALLILGACFVIGALMPLYFGYAGGRRRRNETYLYAEGVPAIATVTGFRDTGMTVNRNPVVELALRVEPRDGTAAFDTMHTMLTSRLRLPYEGQRHPVWFERDKPDNLLLGRVEPPDASPEVRQLFALAAAREAAPPASTGSVGDPLDRLAKLNELRQAGALTDAEFEAQKAKLLNTGPEHDAPAR